jgi:hypothetical protein
LSHCSCKLIEKSVLKIFKINSFFFDPLHLEDFKQFFNDPDETFLSVTHIIVGKKKKKKSCDDEKISKHQLPWMTFSIVWAFFSLIVKMSLP